MPSQSCAGATHVKPSLQRKPGAWHDGNGSKTVVAAGAGVDFGSLAISFDGSGSLARSSFLAACALAGAPGSRMPVARSQERTRARVAASKVKPRMTEQSARTGDCLRAGGPNWCHIGLGTGKRLHDVNVFLQFSEAQLAGSRYFTDNALGTEQELLF